MKKIHIAQDRVLDSNSMKIVMGGNDDTIDGGWLHEVTVWGTDKSGNSDNSSSHTSHDGSVSDCDACKQYILAGQRAGDTATGTSWMDNEYIYNLQLGLTLGIVINHYYQQLFGE